MDRGVAEIRGRLPGAIGKGVAAFSPGHSSTPSNKRRAGGGSRNRPPHRLAQRFPGRQISPHTDLIGAQFPLIERLRYVLSNTVKGNLVASVFDWEGLHSAEALIDGKPLQGIWYDRETEYELRRQAARRGAAVEPVKRATLWCLTR